MSMRTEELQGISIVGRQSSMHCPIISWMHTNDAGASWGEGYFLYTPQLQTSQLTESINEFGQVYIVLCLWNYTGIVGSLQLHNIFYSIMIKSGKLNRASIVVIMWSEAQGWVGMCLADWLIDGLIDWFIDWLIDLLIYWLIDLLIDWSIDR